MAYYATLVTVQGDWGFNMFRVTPRGKMFHVEQFAIPNGTQDIESTSVVYVGGHLAFIAGDRIETVALHKISRDLGDRLLLEHNWERLRQGLANKSQKVAEWLQKKGLPIP